MSPSTAADAPDTGSVPLTIIQPTRGLGIDWGELWRYRELFGFLIWRDLQVRYKQSLLGATWALLVPLLQTLIFAFLFGYVAALPSDGLPKPLFYYTALLPWTYFAGALSNASASLVNSAHLLTKIYIPRLLVPATPCVAGLVDFAIAFLFLVALLVWYGIVPPLSALLLPLLLLLAVLTALGAGVGLAALNVKYRDVRHVVPFVVQIWMFATVIVPFSALPASLGPWRWLYGLNPMAGVIEGFRWCLLHPRMDAPDATWPMLVALGAPLTALLLLAGLAYFRRMERQFADIV